MDAIKLPFQFDREKLREDWQRIEKSEYYEIANPFVQPESIYSTHLIEPVVENVEILVEPVFRPNGRMERCPYFKHVFDTFECEMETFRIHTLIAGGTIRKHRDTGRSFHGGVFRLHIPIQTNPKMETLLNDEPIVMQEGECWYLNFDLPHQLANNGDEQRVHLIIDCRTNDWWRNVFEKCGYQPPQNNNGLQTIAELESYIEALKSMDEAASNDLLEKAQEDLARLKAGT